MIQKIQTLQKRLIGKTEEVVEKDLLIQVRVCWCVDACVVAGAVCKSAAVLCVFSMRSAPMLMAAR